MAHGNIRCRNIIVFHHTSVMEVKLGDPGMVYLFNQLPLEHQCNLERSVCLIKECVASQIEDKPPVHYS